MDLLNTRCRRTLC